METKNQHPQHPRLAVVIVTWNVRDLVIPAIDSVLADFTQTNCCGEVWVVDNASSDGTAAAIRARYVDQGPASLSALITSHRPLAPVYLLEPGSNLGFARGNNHALRAMGFPDGEDVPEYVLLLNCDTVVRSGALSALLDGLEASGAGLAGARLVYGDGSFQHSAFGFPGLAQLVIDLFPVPGRLLESPINGRYARHHYDGDDPFDVDHPLGATFLLKRDVIQTVGVFDEQFHMYCEEIDWAKRIKQAGWRVVCAPRAEVVHYGGQSTSQVHPASVINLWESRLRYYRKHTHPLKRAVAKMIMRAGMNRLIQQTARDSSRSDEARKALIDAYREVIGLTRRI